jgi:5-formyltetrahydrofolate cyclo-ligase
MSDQGKQDLRSELLQDRRSLTTEQVELARTGVRAAVLAQARAQSWGCVAGYVPLRTEPGSVELLDSLASMGLRVLVPTVAPDRDLDWCLWGASPDPLGVGVLAEADAVLVPALAVAVDGTRLGRGGGSYDRALPRVRTGAPIAALLYVEEVRHWLPRDAWDVPVNAVVTPEGWVDLA